MQENFEIRIREFQKLKRGWHFGKGEPFSKEHVEIAAKIAMRYYKKYNISVSGTPCANGNIELAFNKNDMFLDVMVMPEIGNASVKFSKGINAQIMEEGWKNIAISQLDEVFEDFDKMRVDSVDELKD